MSLQPGSVGDGNPHTDVQDVFIEARNHIPELPLTETSIFNILPQKKSPPQGNEPRPQELKNIYVTQRHPPLIMLHLRSVRNLK